jgi:predicted dehydrogenase
VSEITPAGLSRREMITDSGKLAAAATLVGLTTGGVFAASDDTIRVALVGCGGRGGGAAVNALSTKSGPIKLVAMADVFRDRLDSSYTHISKAALSSKLPGTVEVPQDQRFIGFDAYKKAMDCLKKGDVVIFATPPAFRWVHFGYAIEKGLNVFMEKPVTVDGPGSRKMFKLGEESVKKNLKVGVGLMCRHCEARGELFKRIKDGQMGELLTLRAYRMAGQTAMEATPKKPSGVSELLYQIKRFHSFLWASGGCFSDFLIHNIDECCWMKGAWPERASASGGRHYRSMRSAGSDPIIHLNWKAGDEAVDQNFDNYSVEYTFPDGAKLFLEGRTIPGCYQEFASYAHGTKGSAVISQSGHTPCYARMYKTQTMKSKDDLAWEWGKPEPDPYQLEWDQLIQAIRKDTPYNEVKRGVEASLVTAMGRLAAHTGKIVTYDEMLKHDQELAPGLDKLTFESPAPLQATAEGKYPVPMPGMPVKVNGKTVKWEY